jgi:hypothetical protein
MEKNHYRDKSFNIFLSCAFFCSGGGAKIVVTSSSALVVVLVREKSLRMLSDANLISTVCLCVFGLNGETAERKEKKLNFYDQQFAFLSTHPKRRMESFVFYHCRGKTGGGRRKGKNSKSRLDVSSSHLKMKRFSLEIKVVKMQIRTFSMQRHKIIILSFTYFYLNNAVFKKALQHSLKLFFSSFSFLGAVAAEAC